MIKYVIDVAVKNEVYEICDFPGSPVVKTLFQCRGHGFLIFGWGTKDPTKDTMWCRKQRNKNKKIHPYVHSSTSHNSQVMEINLNVHGQMNGQRKYSTYIQWNTTQP